LKYKYFAEFLEIGQRKDKPRDIGLSCVGDSGNTLLEAEKKLEMIVDYIDLVKFVMISRRLLQRDYVKRKVKLYTENDLITFPGGVLTEMAIVQNKFPEFLKELEDVGFTAVEISASEMRAIPLSTHCRLVEIASKDYDLKVLAEIGIHAPRAPGLKVEDSIREINDLMKAGAWKVIIEGAEPLAMGVGEDPRGTKDFKAIIDAVGGPDKIIFEVNRNRALMKWMVATYGPNVNIGNAVKNLEVNQILGMELARRKMLPSIVNPRIHPDILKL